MKEQKITKEDRELEREASLALNSIRLYLESIPDFSTAPLYKGAVAFQALTGARANEFLPNSKYKTFMDVRMLHLNADINGDRWITLPVIEKRRSEKPIKRRIFLLPHVPAYKEDIYLFDVFFKYLKWRTTKEYKVYAWKRICFGAKYKKYEKFLYMPKVLLKSNSEFKSLRYREQRYVISLQKWMWLWKDRKNELEYVLFPLLYRQYLKFLKSNGGIPAYDIEGNVVFLKPHTHLLRKWRISSLLSYGLSPIEVKTFIGWGDIRSINQYIKMDYEYLIKALKKLKLKEDKQ